MILNRRFRCSGTGFSTADANEYNEYTTIGSNLRYLVPDISFSPRRGPAGC